MIRIKYIISHEIDARSVLGGWLTLSGDVAPQYLLKIRFSVIKPSPTQCSPVMKLMVELSQQLSSGSPHVTMVTRKL